MDYLITFDQGYQVLMQASGALHRVTIPGHGVVWATIGRQVWLETCLWDGTEWVCEEELLHGPGMVFNDPETVCNYLINGE